MAEKIHLGDTSGGKKINLTKKKVGNKVARFIEFEGGGQVPKELQGMFSDVGIAQRAVDAYLESLAFKRSKKSPSKTETP